MLQIQFTQKFYCCLFLVISLFSGCNTAEKADEFAITGTVQGLQTDSVYLKNELSDSVFSAAVQNNTFTLRGKVQHPDVFNLYLDSAQKISIPVFVENTNITLTGTIDAVKDMQVAGSSLQLEQQVFEKSIQTINTLLDSIQGYFGKAWQRGDINAIDSLNETYLTFSNQKLQRILAYSKSNPASWILPVITYQATVENPESVLIDSIYANVQDDIKNSPRFLALMDIHEKTKPTALGQQAPDFSMQTINHGQLNLSTLTGKIVLLDFWASWCSPCRANHPDLVALYKQYKNDDFEIVSISLDKKDNLWKEAVNHDKLTWIQAFDLKGGKGDAAQQYSVQFVPASFLLDRSGKIVAKDIHGKKLKKKVDELLASAH